MNIWLFLNFAMEIWGILLCIGMAIIVHFAQLSAKQKNYAVQMLGCIVIMMIASLLGRLTEGNPGRTTHYLMWCSYYLYFVMTYILVYAYIRMIFGGYFPELEGKESYIDMMKKLQIASRVMIFLITLSLINHMFFYIGPDNIYHRGPLFILLQGYTLLMCIYGILWAGLHEKQFPKKAVKRSLIDAGAVGVGIAVQYFLPRYEIINIVLMLLAMECFLHILIGNIQMLAEQKQELELQKAINRSQQSEIMISQIQPHFLYNTLNSIYYLCDQDPELAKEAISEFSEYLRGNLKSFNKNEPIPIDEEMEHVRNYLWLEKLRFEERLNVEWDIRCHSFSVPALSVQPLVENAVKHGICKKPEGGTISIRTREHTDRYEVIVKDDGVGFQAENHKNLRNAIPAEVEDNAPENRHTFIGIENVRSRIHAMSGGNLFLDSEPGKGTIVVLTIRK